jgi:hypothetical protein
VQTALWPDFPVSGKSTGKIFIPIGPLDYDPQSRSQFLHVLTENSPNKTGKLKNGTGKDICRTGSQK